MLLNRVILSLGGPGFGDKRSCDGNCMTLLLGGEVGKDEDASERFGSLGVRLGLVFLGVACDDGACVDVFGDDIFGCVVDIFGLDSGVTDFDGGGLTLPLGGEVSRDEKATRRFGSR